MNEITPSDQNYFRIKYDGRDAENHLIPARHLARSLEGVDRIVVRFLSAIETQVNSERSPSSQTVHLSVRAPKAGSVDVSLFPEVAAAFMPFVGTMTEAIRGKLCEHIANYVMLFWGGRRKEADSQMEKMLDILDKHTGAFTEDRHREREAQFADRKHEREHVAQLLRDQALLHRDDAVKVATPVGESCSSIGLVGSDATVTIDEATAGAIKAKKVLEVSDVITMTFKVEGIQLSSKTLRIYDPEVPGRVIRAHISDPSFDPVHPSENSYELAVQSRAHIELTGKATRDENGKLVAFHAVGGEIKSQTP